MTKQDPQVAAVVERLKMYAQASPRIHLSVAPAQHYHLFPDGLILCFTLDRFKEFDFNFWHLSIARLTSPPTREETELWSRAFFDKEPDVKQSRQRSRHFYWRYEGNDNAEK